MNIEVTQLALSKIKSLSNEKNIPAILRLGIRAGGCNGYSYLIEWESEVRGTDLVFNLKEDVKVVVDSKSAPYLDGSILDYNLNLLSRGFKIINPNETASCGCGLSIQLDKKSEI